VFGLIEKKFPTTATRWKFWSCELAAPLQKRQKARHQRR